MKNLNELRTIMLSEEKTGLPLSRIYHGEWIEVAVAIGPTGSAYVQMQREDYDKLLEPPSDGPDED